MQYDNLEDRKEIYNMLANYLDERQIKQFLEWCCKETHQTMGKLLRPGKKSTYHPQEVYWQLMSLSLMHGLNLNSALTELTRISRIK